MTSIDITSECYQLGVGGKSVDDLPRLEAERARLVRGCTRWAVKQLCPRDGDLPAIESEIEDELVAALLGAKDFLGVEFSTTDAFVEAARILGGAKAMVARADAQRPLIRSLGKGDLAVEHIRDVAERVRAEHGKGSDNFLSTPWPDLNKYTVGGFGPGELIILGARPGVGKTAIALELARYAAGKGKTVLVVSREMINSALVRRLISQTARIPASDLKLGRVEASLLDAGIKSVSDLPLWLCDKALNGEEIETACDVVPGGVDFLVVDYLQLVYGPPGIKEMRLIVDRVAWQLKTIAQQREIPVLCLSALTREADGQPPTMRHLRESGSLEHHANVVLFLHRKDPENKSEVDLIIAKGRDGYEGIVPLRFAGEYVSFLGEATDGGWTPREDEPEAQW